MSRRNVARFLLAAWFVSLTTLLDADTLIDATRVAGGLSRPVYVTSPPEDTSHLYIVEAHTGQIKILNLDDNTINTTPFLDIAGTELTTGSEQGLLGLAFHPDYATNGQFYVNFTNASGNTVIRRYTRSAGDPNVANAGSAQTVLTYAQPQSNHNGGWLGFNPKTTPSTPQYLYISSGDGGGGNDQGTGHTEPNGNAQDLTSNLLGKMLRIDVNGDAFPGDANRNYQIPAGNPLAVAGNTGDDEIWDWGLRNPWRPSFDRQTGDLIIADVGQGVIEEVNFEPALSGGRNYGWRVMEGNNCFRAGDDIPCNDPRLTPPIHTYPHSNIDVSITGGYVYRGPATALQGQYFFADFNSAKIWSFRYDGTTKTEFQERTGQIATNAGLIQQVASFGEDANGNLYVVDLSGEVFRFNSAREVLISSGATWRYLDNGSNQGTTWRALSFDDSAWRTGISQFGYGDGDENTVVDCGLAAGNECSPSNNPPGKFATTYFRKTFTVDDPTLIESLSLHLKRDDGAAVYLNGVEILRTASLSPTATNTDLANFGGAAAVDATNELTFFISAVDVARLQAGENILAVEIHQHSLTSSDVSFDLRLVESYKSLIPGDANQNGEVDRTDAAILAVNYGQETGALWTDGDFDGDGKVALSDLELLQAHLGEGDLLAVPEPGTAGLVGLMLPFAWIAARYFGGKRLHPHRN